MNQSKLKISVETIRNMYVGDGLTTAAIAKIAGCTTQHLGQVLKSIGVDVKHHALERRRKTLRSRADARRKKEQADRVLRNELRAAARKRADEVRFDSWRRQWAQGATALEIALYENRSLPSVKATIRRLRTKYCWFHRRRATLKMQSSSDLSKVE